MFGYETSAPGTFAGAAKETNWHNLFRKLGKVAAEELAAICTKHCIFFTCSCDDGETHTLEWIDVGIYASLVALDIALSDALKDSTQSFNYG